MISAMRILKYMFATMGIVFLISSGFAPQGVAVILLMVSVGLALVNSALPETVGVQQVQKQQLPETTAKLLQPEPQIPAVVPHKQPQSVPAIPPKPKEVPQPVQQPVAQPVQQQTPILQRLAEAGKEMEQKMDAINNISIEPKPYVPPQPVQQGIMCQYCSAGPFDTEYKKKVHIISKHEEKLTGL